MKLAFLRTKISIVVVGLILGLFVGFKVANNQYRREQRAALDKAVAQAAGGSSNGPASTGGQDLTPEQQDQIIKQTRAVIDKANQNPEDVEAQLDAAEQFIQINRPEEAIKFLQQANKVNPNDARAAAGLGMANLMMGKYDESIRWSRRSIELSPKNPGATFILAASYIQANRDLDEAERLLNQLEADGVNRDMVSQARQELRMARSGNRQNSGSISGSGSVLEHGPRQ
jgi:tetratricopeptide (TPR) repeat protein